MFVSSFSTYTTNNYSQKVAKDRADEQRKESHSFQFKRADDPLKLSNSSAKPVDYISNAQTAYTKQMLEISQKKEGKAQKSNEFETTQKSTKNFQKTANFKSATSAYSNTFTTFGSLRKPHVTVSNQTPHVDKNLPKEAQKAQENNIRHTMVNTYMENEKYYKRSA